MKKLNIKALFTTLLVTLLTTCTAQPSSPPTSTAQVPPAVEPPWLSILYPERAQIVSQSEYDQDIGFGTKSAICVEIAAQNLVEAGDYWEAGDVIERTVVFVDGVQRYHSGGVKDYIVGFYFDGDRDVGGPYAFCMSAPVGVGIHRVDINFKKSSGMTATFSWSFEIVENSIPTSTPLPEPTKIDKQGKLPPYLRAVYPAPGQMVSLEKYVEIAPEDTQIWESNLLNKFNQSWTSDLLDKKPICIAFRTDELKVLGSLPTDHDDWPSRIYIKIDNELRENWLGTLTIFYENRDPDLPIQTSCLPGELPPGDHTVTLYIHPYNEELVMYSWGFTITK